MRILICAATVLLAAALGAGWWRSERDAARAGALAATLEDLGDSVPSLTDEILKLRAAITKTQDEVVRAVDLTRVLVDQTAAQAAELGADRDFDVVRAVASLPVMLQEKERLVERLRTNGAQIASSIDTLVELEHSAGTQAPDGLHDLVRSALLYERSSRPETGALTVQALDRLTAARAKVPPETAEDLRFAIAHGRRILDLCPQNEAELRKLVDRTMEAAIDAIQVQVVRRRDESSGHALAFRDALIVVGALFLLSIAALVQHARRRASDLNRANALLESRVDERTRQLSDREAETRAILQGSAEGILSVEENGTIRSLNPAVAVMFGRPESDLTGRAIGDFVTPGWPEVLKSGGRKRDGTGSRPGGATFPLEIIANPVRLGERLIHSVILRDVTERHRVDQMKNEFISTVSHELRTPLTSIRGALGLVSSGALGALAPKAKPMVDIAAKNCERLVNLVSDILDIEKIASGKMAFRIRTLQLSEVVTQTVDAARGFAESLGVTLSVQAPAGDLLVLADSDRLAQVLTNLVSNASKYSAKGGTVTIAVARREGKLRVSVADLGPGIPDEFRARIFQKFAQADTTDGSQRKGTGLGLAISKALIERMGGTIGFDTKVGVGSTFFFDLNEERPTAPVSTPSPRPRLLVVEDERDISEVLRLMLEREGYDSDLAPTLKDARALLAARTYAGMTLDLSLPDGSGVELLRELRQNPLLRSLPVIVISANLEQNRQALNGNAFNLVDWLEKPIPQDRLEQALRRSCDPVSNRKPRVLHVEDDADIAAIVSEVLAPTAEVTRATTVMSAWELLKAEDFDLLILDINLPDGSGLELLPALRRSTGQPVPSIVFSAHEISPRTARTVTAALLKSKTSSEQLVARVRALLGKAGPVLKA